MTDKKTDSDTGQSADQPSDKKAQPPGASRGPGAGPSGARTPAGPAGPKGQPGSAPEVEAEIVDEPGAPSPKRGAESAAKSAAEATPDKASGPKAAPSDAAKGALKASPDAAAPSNGATKPVPPKADTEKTPGSTPGAAQDPAPGSTKKTAHDAKASKRRGGKDAAAGQTDKNGQDSAKKDRRNNGQNAGKNGKDGKDGKTPPPGGDGRAPDKSAKGPRKRGGALPWILVLLLLVFVGGAAAGPLLIDNLARLGLPVDRLLPAPGPTGDATGAATRSDGTVRALQSRLDQLRTDLADQQERVARLARDLDDARSAAETARRTAERALTQGTQAAQAGDTPAAAPAPAPTQTIDTSRFADADALAGLRDRVDSLANQIAATGDDGTKGAIGAVQDRVAALKTRVDTLARTKLEPEELDTLRQSLGGRVDTLEREVAQLASEVTGVAQRSRTGATGPSLAYEVAKLQRKLDSGEPFKGDLRVIESLLAETPSLQGRAAEPLATLNRFADGGIAPHPVLADRFTALSAEVMRQTAKAQAEEGGLWSNLEATASSLITVRPATPDEADGSLAADITRIERAVRADRLAAALALVDALPQAGQNALTGWVDRVRDRLAAERAADRLYGLVTGKSPSSGDQN
ncbi:hypothetical protein CCR85_07420 [Rhodothalassium salexigens]|uniref:hypothetical protein n=1 Tax=Rhodothalassium salexigens TaxID=1086 RepID=UPI001911FABB|nr:hypothetical protein [Rhodothalassium salexigens]MBK5911321.1 hypothetical protein [Rhodothalassium salexigens]